MDSSEAEKNWVSFPRGRILINKRYTNINDYFYAESGYIYIAHDSISNRDVQIRIIVDALGWNDRIKGILNEIKLMKHYQHENILQLYDVEFYEQSNWLILCLITESMEANLDAVIKSYQDLTDLHIKFFIYQILRALSYIHSAGVILGNLSPKVIGINSNCDAKITDFWFCFSNNTTHWSEDHIYDADRLFLAPECLNITPFVTTKSDIWSAGCIMATLLRRRQPLFNSENSYKQLSSMFEVLGAQAEDDLLLLNDRAFALIQNLPKNDKMSFGVLFPEVDSLAIDFLEKMLVFNPMKRWDAEKLLKHEYLKDFYEPELDNITAAPFEFDYHNVLTKRNVLSEKLNSLIGRSK